MNGADWFIVLLIVISCVIGAMRGLMREGIALITWLLGLYLAWAFSDVVEPYLGGLLGREGVRIWVARLLILVAVLVIGTLVGLILQYMIRHSPFGTADRVLGTFFGLVRGAVVVGVLVIVGELLLLNQERWWTDSRLLPYAQYMGDAVRSLVDEVEVPSKEEAREILGK
jgi:membrane protein required for colicin V production